LPFLVETVVVDYPDKMAGVTLENVRKWGVAREEVFERARANVAEMPTAVSSYDGPDGSIQIVDMGDHYEAARVLVPALLLEIAKSFTGRPVIAIPHRSVMLVTDDARGEHVVRLAETAQREYASSPRSLSPALYTIDQDGRCAPYVREGRTEVANAVARGHYQLAAAEFADQKAALDKAYEADGTDVYVAAFDIIRVKNDGHYFSYTVWAENVDSLLPRADYVGLTDHDGKPCFVPWETVQRLVGDCWELDAKLDPARVRTVRWPDHSVVEELRANAVSDL
jgi:hypothetical protein